MLMDLAITPAVFSTGVCWKHDVYHQVSHGTIVSRWLFNALLPEGNIYRSPNRCGLKAAWIFSIVT
jgi:hypothetical protein